MTAAAAPSRRFTPPRALVVFAVVVVATFAASRACQGRGDVDQAEAVAIARGAVDFRPDGVNVRFLRRGAGQQPYWAVSVWQRDRSRAELRRITVVVVSAETGEVTEIRRER